MKTLLREADRHELIDRLNSLKLDSSAQWGRMNAHQMLCHCSDAFRMATGERPVPPRKARPMLKWVALYSPFPWPKGFRSRRQLDQQRDGTRPIEFEADRDALIELLRRFSQQKSAFGQHALFGEMTASQWMRWAYRHTAHHLSQFGK